MAFNLVRGMDFKVIEGNQFLLQFHHNLDRNKVLERAPWAFDKCLVILAAVEEHQSPCDIKLNWCEFHILVHGLPLGKMTREMAVFCGNRIGHFVDLDSSDGGGLWGPSLHIRVALDVRQPLRRLLKIRIVMGDEHVIYFRYEHFPNFCYLCGCLGAYL
ncbi:UNVERIFIED_CONTAM: hypothetical protein Sradi_6466900 [Sesamum radiatum]|uniref:DUF4283 domain-containing protein n=1 Tax=Sesamum radiatum TaxID=300843 RepID=A0AAW2K738_SESRA